MATQSQTSVMKLYHSVIEDVIAGVRDSFLDEGVDEQVLQELKQIWETKLLTSKAVELNPDPPEPQPPQIGNQKDGRGNISGKSGGANAKKAAAAAAAVIAASESVNMGNQTTVFTTNQHGTQQNVVTQQTQLVQQVGQQPTTQAQTMQLQSIQQQTQQLQQNSHLAQQSQNIQQAQQGQQTQAPQQTATVITTDPNKQVPIHITLPAQAGTADSQPRVLTIQVPASALQGNQLHAVLTGPIIAATMALPQHLASSLLQQHVTAALQGQAASGATQMQQVTTALAQNTTSNGSVMAGRQGFQQTGTIRQLDGLHDTSDEDDDDDDDDDLDDDDENDDKDDDENEEENDGGPEEEPLNSEDDVSDEDPTDLFDTDNVVVCQYDKITRSRNKWKFYLKDGIMNLSGKDYVFQKANGDAEW